MRIKDHSADFTCQEWLIFLCHLLHRNGYEPIDPSCSPCFFIEQGKTLWRWRHGLVAYIHSFSSTTSAHVHSQHRALSSISEENRCPGCCMTHFISVFWDAVGVSAGCFIANKQPPPEWTFAHFQRCKFPRVPSGAWSDALAITLTDLIAHLALPSAIFLSYKIVIKIGSYI